MSERVERHEWSTSDGSRLVAKRGAIYAELAIQHRNDEILNLATQLAAEREKVRERDERITELTLSRDKTLNLFLSADRRASEWQIRAEAAERDLAEANKAIRCGRNSISHEDGCPARRSQYQECECEQSDADIALRRALGEGK